MDGVVLKPIGVGAIRASAEGLVYHRTPPVHDVDGAVVDMSRWVDIRLLGSGAPGEPLLDIGSCSGNSDGTILVRIPPDDTVHGASRVGAIPVVMTGKSAPDAPQQMIGTGVLNLYRVRA